ncbi:MAG: serine hydrolase [Flavobacteriales bacterium]|nr:serine hydrolase [Flavobacteriales bacterium]
MKFIKRFFMWLLLVLGVLVVLLLVTGNKHILSGLTKTYLKGVNRPDIDDMGDHALRVVPAGSGEPWAEKYLANATALAKPFLRDWEQYGTTALLVIVDDTIRYEQYWEGTHRNTLSNSFSMAKSFTSMAIGAAFADGSMAGPREPLGSYIAQYATGENAALKLEDLLTMTSGIDFGESYVNPFGYQARAYFGDDLAGNTLAFGVCRTPLTQWKYEGGNTVLLGMALQEATGKHLATYFSEKIWSRIGAEQDAYWNLDHEDGLEKAFSAFYATARDFARIGQLMLDSGEWKGREVLPREYFRAAMTPVNVPDVDGAVVEHYGWQWWLARHEGHPFASARGMRGQYIVALPHLNAVIVRLGHERPDVYIDHVPLDMQWYIKFTTSIVEELSK